MGKESARYAHFSYQPEKVFLLDGIYLLTVALDPVLRQAGQIEPVGAWCRASTELSPTAVAGIETDSGRRGRLVESVNRDGTGGLPVWLPSGGPGRTGSGSSR